MEMPRLTGDQRSVLNALMAERGAKTEAALRDVTEVPDVGRILRELETQFDPPLVAQEFDATLQTRVWIATIQAGDLFDAER
jgi:hypothetical protein